MVLVTHFFKQKESRTDEKIPHKTYEVPFDAAFAEEFVTKTGMEEGMWRLLVNLNELRRVSCERLLNSTELIQDLRNVDLIVYEATASCTPLVADLLGVRRVVILPVSPNIARCSFFQIPCPVAYIPSMLTTFTSEMSFIQRLTNLGLYVFTHLASYIMLSSSMSPLKNKYNITPGISYLEALGNNELVIIEADFSLEYPQPLLPGLPKYIIFKISMFNFKPLPNG